MGPSATSAPFAVGVKRHRHNHLSATFTRTACRPPSPGEGEGRKDCWVNRLNTDCARAPGKKKQNKPPNAFKLITSVREQRRSSDGRRHVPASCYDSMASVLTESRASPPHTKPGSKARVTIQDCICSVRPQGMCVFFFFFLGGGSSTGE